MKMRKYINFIIISLVLVVFGLTGCYEQEVADIVSPDGYAVAAITPDFTGDISEVDTITYTVTLDKMRDFSTTFTAKIDEEASSLSSDYYEVIDAVIPAYGLEAQLTIIFMDDGIPSPEAKNLKFEIGNYDIYEKYTLNETTEFLSQDISVKNYNDPTLLTIIFSWPTDDDMDIVTWSDTDDYPLTEWGDGGATGANPEMDQSIWLADPLGTYYVNIMDWGVGAFDYKFTLGHPDGSVQIIEGTFSGVYDDYVNDPWTAWGGAYDSYRVLKVVNDGTKFVVTEL